MSAQIELEKTRHQVAVCGRVSDAETGLAIAGVLIEIVQMPEAFKKWLALHSKQYGKDWETRSDRPDRTKTSADGHFYFLDLPDGEYTLLASLKSAGTRYGTARAVAAATRDSKGNSVRNPVSIALPPTAIKGQISDSAHSPIVMAKIQIEGSLEYSLSDSQGNYLLSGLETSKLPGKRSVTVKVSARGYQSASQRAELNQGEVQNLNFSLSSV